jgi:uncharacterized protein YecT (DUF1311 family)
MPYRAALLPALLAFLSMWTPARAEDALDCQEALSTVEMNRCAGAEFEKADKELNEVYQKALAEIPEMAGDDPLFDAKAWEAALRASQRSWIAFRDAECEGHVAMFWSGGSGATVDIIGCKTEKTEARIRELRARYENE